MNIKWLFFLAILFLAAVFLSWSLSGFPSLDFAAVLVVTLFSSRKKPQSAIIFGTAAGLFLDLVSPEIVGTNAFVFALVAYIISVSSSYFRFYNPFWYVLVGIVAFLVRGLFIGLFNVIISGELIITSQLRGFISAALWTGITAGAVSMIVPDRWLREP